MSALMLKMWTILSWIIQHVKSSLEKELVWNSIHRKIATVNKNIDRKEQGEVMPAYVQELEGRYYKTYKARLELWKRLDRHRVVWNWYLIVSSLSTLIVSILSLASESKNTIYTEIIVIVLSLCTFTGSLVLTSLRLPERSKDAFRAYRAIQALSLRLEAGRRGETELSEREFTEIRARYDQLMDETENHSELDYFASLDFEDVQKSWVKKAIYWLQLYWPALALIPILILTGIATIQSFPLV